MNPTRPCSLCGRPNFGARPCCPARGARLEAAGEECVLLGVFAAVKWAGAC